MRYFGLCPGSCGELVQGFIGEREYLASYGIPFFSTAEIESSKIPIMGPRKSREVMEKAFEYFGYDKKETRNYSLRIKSNIPRGKGMASSTADIGATLGAVSQLLQVDIDEKLASTLAASVEPTDSIFYRDINIFDPLKGETIEILGFIEGLKILMIEPKDTLNTLLLRSQVDYMEKKIKNIPHMEEVFEELKVAFKTSNKKLLGKACTKSSLLNEVIHQKKYLEKIIEISEKSGALGVNVAHSGTVIGILMNENHDSKEIETKIREIDSEKYYKYYTTLNVIKGGIKSAHGEDNPFAHKLKGGGLPNGIYKKSYGNRK